MGWARVKTMFKKKKKNRDEVITFTGGVIGLEDKNINYKLDPTPEVEYGMRIVCIDKGMIGGKQMFEVNGVMLDAEDILDAQRKYLRHRRMEDDEG